MQSSSPKRHLDSRRVNWAFLLAVIVLIGVYAYRVTSKAKAALPMPEVSHARGFHNEPFEVTITSAKPGARIYYTLDGTPPAPGNGTRYHEPIRIEGNTIFRAAAFKWRHLPSRINTQSYLFLKDVIVQTRPESYPKSWADGYPADYDMDPEVVNDPAYAPLMEDALKAIPTLSIVTAPDNLFHPMLGIHMNTAERGDDWERPVSAEFITANGDGTFQIDCGFRMQGAGVRLPGTTPKHSFRLVFDEAYGTAKLEAPLFGEGATTEFDDTLILRAGQNNTWLFGIGEDRRRSLLIRDQYARDLQLATGNLAAHGRFVHLYLNGLYWGVYNLTERNKAAFMAKYLGGEAEDYDVISACAAVEGNKQAWDEMSAIFEEGVANDAVYARVQEYLDIDNLIDYMIVNHFIATGDWCPSNWWAGRHRQPGATFKFYCWDSEYSLRQIDENIVADSFPGTPQGVYWALKENAEYRIRYADHIARHFLGNGVMTPKRAADLFRARSDELNLAIIGESARWGDYRRDLMPIVGPFELYTRNDHWLPHLQWLLNEYFPRRTEVVLKQYIDFGLYPDVPAPEFSHYGGAIDTPFELTIQAPQGTVYYTTDGLDPRLPGGKINEASATAYTAPIAITPPAQIKARALRDDTWSALMEAAFTVPTEGP